jgi:indolepyruvate ferredoxin oxidoreductase
VPVFRLLAKLRGLRGTALDVFGYSVERRQERALIQRYEAVIAEVLPLLEDGGAHYDTLLELVSLPEQIRGYGHVRAKAMALAKQRESVLLDVLRGRVIALKKVA